MNRFTGSLLLLFLPVFACITHPAFGVTSQAAVPEEWKSTHAQHVYGMPGTKSKEKGTLEVTPSGVTFTGKSSSYAVQSSSIIAVSAGSQRVELWGTKGRILRMVIPNGGGIAVAGVMHHRVDMLTVEFRDGRGGYHGAVFFLPANEADRAFQCLSRFLTARHEVQSAVCSNAIQPGSVLVSAPAWDQVQVPAAYRALVYEHLVDRLQRLAGVSHVFRDGENDGQARCPQYDIHISIAGFKQGSQVKRAVMGPAGMFVETTQMTFDATFTDASGKLNEHQQVKASVRGESESTNVADSVAKSLVKHYSVAQKEFEKPGTNR